MKKLYILRHGKSDYPEGVKDHERPLNKRGQRSSFLIGKYLKLNQINPDVILSSDSLRTTQTIQNATTEAGITTKINYNGVLYLATPGEMLKELSKLKDDVQSVLLVCHNPGAEMLTAILARDGNKMALNNYKRNFPTCGIASIKLNAESWGKLDVGSGYLEEFATPKTLANLEHA
jgi:phosphohistidine phosphatase